MQHVQGTQRNQQQFFNLEDRIAQDNPARLLDHFVDQLDLKRLHFHHTVHHSEGRPPYHPSVLLKLYLYGYLNGIRSSRRLQTECERNVELWWLLEQRTPNYHTIANFRKQHTEQLKTLFKLYVQFLATQGLLGKRIIAVDGSKLRAQNSKKNNYNQEKINRQIAYIDGKAAEYMQALDQIDQQEEQKALLIKQQLKQLRARKKQYRHLEQQLAQSGEEQISTTDSQSRALLIHRNIVEVCYNMQTAVDDKHNLLVHVKAVNEMDRNALHCNCVQAKSNMGLSKTSKLTALADKGFHNGRQLQQCTNDHILTYVGIQAQGQSREKSNVTQSAYYVEHFRYNKAKDYYTCPEGHRLYTSGAWHHKKRREHSSYQFKKYRTPACKYCPVRHLCTGRQSGGREIERSEFQQAVDQNTQRVRQRPDIYKRRQAMCEHPFGTLKRQWGYSYVLLKGLQKVDAEVNLMALVYDLKRTFNILGFATMQKALKGWTPDYKKVSGAAKTGFGRSIANLINQRQLLASENCMLKQAA
jgi:transposase